MHKRDDRISEADWKDLIKYWRSPEFEVSKASHFLAGSNINANVCTFECKCKFLQARSSIAKENRAKSTVPHTAGSKSHARVTQEMVRIFSRLEKKGDTVFQELIHSGKQQMFVG
jgi:hypothetical protein